MPKITDARHLTLSDIVDQLEIDDQHDARELRSRGNDLYVKEKPSAAAPTSRKSHRDNAIGLVRDSLAQEFRTTTKEAQQILESVFKQTPTRITVSDVVRLRNLGLIATDICTSECKTLLSVFELAQKHEAYAVAPGDSPEESRHSEISTPDTAPRNAPAAAPQNAPDTIRRRAHDLATGNADPDQVSSELTLDNEREALFTAMREEIPTQSLNASSAYEEMAVWFRIALTMGHPKLFTHGQLRRLSAEQRLSMQRVLAFAFKRYQKMLAPPRTLIPVVHANHTLNQCYLLTELIAPEEEKTLDEFISEVGNNSVIRAASAKWHAMDNQQRREVLEIIIDLHAEKFGYTENRPALELVYEDTAEAHADLDGSGERITVVNQEMIRDFFQIFNVITHELTHKTELEIAKHEIDSDGRPSLRAQLFDNTIAFYTEYPYLLELRIPTDEAWDIHSTNPREQHAYHLGDYAESELRKIVHDSPLVEDRQEEFGIATQRAHALATGRADPGQVLSELTSDKEREALFTAMGKEMSALPPFASSTESETAIWLRIALTMGHPKLFTHGQLRQLSTEQRLSMQRVLAASFDDYLSSPSAPRSALVTLARAKHTLNQCYLSTELISPEEEKTLDEFVSEVGNNDIVRPAAANWLKMDNEQRQEVLETIIDLHAAKFGYATNKPALELAYEEMAYEGTPTSTAALDDPGERLTVFVNQRAFLDFFDVFKTITHELTHKTELEIAKHEIDSDGRPSLRAQIFGNTKVFYGEHPYLLALRIPPDEAWNIYMTNPRERHAYHMSDYAESEFRKTFVQQNPTGE